jgi:N-acetylmuramoyl-L-alanine amidase
MFEPPIRTTQGARNRKRAHAKVACPLRIQGVASEYKTERVRGMRDGEYTGVRLRSHPIGSLASPVMLHRSVNVGVLLATCLCVGMAGAVPRPKIVVDPGHGGPQEGAIGPGGVYEKDLALILARRLKLALEKTVNAEVILTREEDAHLPLLDRVEYANRKSPDVFISLHANSMPTKRLRERTEGVETYFLSASASGVDAVRVADRENADAPTAAHAASLNTLDFILNDLARAEAHGDSSRLAYAVHQKLIRGTKAVDRGVQQAPFYVLTGVAVPAILVEVGFISHPREGRKLLDPKYQARLADSISEGVKAFLEEAGRRDRQTKLARP